MLNKLLKRKILQAVVTAVFVSLITRIKGSQIQQKRTEEHGEDILSHHQDVPKRFSFQKNYATGCQKVGLHVLNIGINTKININCSRSRSYASLKLDILHLPMHFTEKKYESKRQQSMFSLVLFHTNGSQHLSLLVQKIPIADLTSFRNRNIGRSNIIDVMNLKIAFQGIVYVRSNAMVCKCFRVRSFENARSRRRRSVANFDDECPNASQISYVSFELNTAYKSLASEESSHIVNQMASYAGKNASRIKIEENIGFTFIFYPAKIVTLGQGDSALTVENNTVLEYVLLCGAISSTHSQVIKIQKDATGGSLTRTLGKPVARWFILVRERSKPTTTETPQSLTTTQSGPQAPQANGPVNVYLSNTTFRTEYAIPVNTFIDKEDGDARNLRLYLYSASGAELPKATWISLEAINLVLKVFSTHAIYNNQPSSGYKYRLSAIDSSGSESHTDVQVSFGGPLSTSSYLRTMLLSSSTSVIIASFYDVDILFLLQSKMAAYLNINANDFLNHGFTVTRTNNVALTVKYEFSTRSLVGGSCNTTAINHIRSKMDGAAAAEAFTEALKPQFSVTSFSGETFKDSCSSFSSREPGIGDLIGPVEIQVGKYFSVLISNRAFLSPSGSNMRLRLELRFQNNTVVPSGYWIDLSARYLDQGAAFQGIVTPRTALSFSSMTLRLVAVTPLLMENFQSIQFSVQKSSSVATFSVIVSQNSAITGTMISFVKSFLTYVSSYLGISESSIVIIDLRLTANATITWTISSLSTSPCKTSEIAALKRKLINDNGSINMTFKTGLTNSVSFTPSSIKLRSAGDCDRPTVHVKIPQLQVPTYGSLAYVIPSNAFHDETDGAKLKLSLLDQNGNVLPSNSWIWFNDVARTISGFPFDLPNGTFRYILRASDTDGFHVDQNISIVLQWMQPSYKFFYFLRFSYSPQLLPVSNVITMFIQKIKAYFTQPSAENVIIFRTLFLSNNRMSLYYQNTSLNNAICDVIGSKYIMSRISDTSEQGKPNSNFITAMQPDFTIEEVKEEQQATCYVSNRKPPVFNSSSKVISDFFEEVKVVPYCGASTYSIPAYAFFDEEQGNTRNLKLNLTTLMKHELPINSWVALNESSQVIYAVAPDDIYSLNVGSNFEYKLVATDLDGKSADASMKFKVNGPPPRGHYNVTMTLDVLRGGHESYTMQITVLLEGLMAIFNNSRRIHVRSYNIEKTSSGKLIAELVWSPCNMLENVCDTKTIETIQSKLFTLGTKDVNPTLRSLIKSGFEVTSIKESLTGPCIVEPPFLFSPVPSLVVNFNGPFSFRIPADTFKDKQDGNTTKLRLDLLQANANIIPSGFWLQFDAEKQHITAILTQEQSSSSYLKQHSFILVATDSTNLSVNTTVKVKINGSMERYSHTFSIQTVFTTSKTSNILYTFASKIKSYFADQRSNIQVITAVEGSGNALLVTWSNSSLRYDPCDVIEIQKIRLGMQTDSGTIRAEFANAMKPEFVQIFITETSSGPCERDQPPVSAVPFGPIKVTTCDTFSTKIPEVTFSDSEQGNTRNLHLTLKENPYYWVYFDSKQQEMTIVITREIANRLSTNTVTVELTATDLSLQTARQSITINIEFPPKSPTHKVEMRFVPLSTPAVGNLVPLYQAMRSNILKHFSQSGVLTKLEYVSLPQVLSSGAVANAEWSSCSLSRDICDSRQVDTLKSLLTSNGIINSAFRSALSPATEVISANVSLDGVCKDYISAPIVQNSLPIIDIGYCGHKVFQIPENTFFDELDGNTRNLTLSILNSSNQVPTETWFHFDTTKQTVWVVLADDALPSLTIPSILTYNLNAATKRGLSVTDKLQFRISEQHPNVSFSLKLNFAWQDSSPPNRNVILATVMNRIASYSEGRASDLHFSSVGVSKAGFGLYFVVNIANCTIRYEPCDTAALQRIQKTVHDQSGTLDSFKEAMGREIYITYVQVKVMGPCNKKNTAPYVKKPLSKIRVHSCSYFNYTIPSATFSDEEQVNLHLSVTMINGLPVSGSYQWVEIDTRTGVLHGIVTESVRLNIPVKGYNLTIRATDNGKLFVETYLIVEIIENVPQKLYQFTMTMNPKTTGASKFTNEMQIIQLLNSFFESRFTNLMMSMVVSEGITIRGSICTMPRRCDEALASSYFNRIITSQNTVPTALVSHFSRQFTLVSTAVYRNPLCRVSLNPPVPSKPMWSVTGSYCGGFRVLVPADLFFDKEDGNTRNLDLRLSVNGSDVSSSYWVQLNKTSQEVYGFPTRQITLSYRNSTKIMIVAKDATGQEASIMIDFSFTEHPVPKYVYQIAYHGKSNPKAIDDLMQFSTKVKVFLNDRLTSSFGLLQHIETPNGVHYLDFANCSVSYDPCDIYTLALVKNHLLTGNNLPTSAFSTAMQPFVINYGTVKLSGPCAGAATHPPIVVNRIHMLNISVWSIFTFQIPFNTFYDTEDGSTRKLALSLTDGKNQVLTKNSWLQLNANTQVFTAFASVSLALTQPSSGYSYMLTATDSSKLSATNMFYVKIYGPLQILKDCQIQMRFNANIDLSSSSNNALANIVSKAIQQYFSFGANDIGLVDFIRHASTQFTFSWSYASPLYRQSSESVHKTTVDYKSLIFKVLRELFQEDRKTVKTSFYSAFSSMSVISVKTAFSGVCANIPPVLSSLTSLSLAVNNFGYKMLAIEAGWFYDFEDGNTFNLKLQLLSAANATLGIESWVNIDASNRKLMMSLRDKQRLSGQITFYFYLKATDSGGKTAFLPISIRKLEAVNTISPFKITFEFTIPPPDLSFTYVNQSITISDSMAQVYSLNNGNDIITAQFSAQAGPALSRIFTWLPSNYQACSSSTVLQKTKELLQRNTDLLATFRAKFLPNFVLQRVHYLSSCGYPGLPPSTSATVVVLNITMCAPFTYKLPDATFIDSVDGEMPNMRIRLLGSDRQVLSSGSWIQLNTATLQIYAVFQSTIQQSSSMISSSGNSYEFNLEASNSRGLKSYKQVKVNILKTPFTSDCYLSINVERRFGATDMLDLDVLYKLIDSISSFYADKTVNIKVHQFKKISAFSYFLTFSNCTFTFATMTRAKIGLDESYRSAINSIFSRIIRSDGTLRESFASALSSVGFNVLNAHASFNCIEEPPYAKVREIKKYAFLCIEYKDPLAVDLFNDTRDGTNLVLSFRYLDGTVVSPNEWLQLDQKTRTVYGIVTAMQKKLASSMDRYQYLLFATDSSGRSTNISYIVSIANSVPEQSITFILGFQSTFNGFSKTVDLFLNLTNNLARYLDNNDQGKNIVIRSYQALNVITWEHCMLACESSAVMRVLGKLQRDAFKPLPSDAFKAAMGPAVTPLYIFANGPKCVEQTNVVITTRYNIVNFNGSTCGNMDYSIPADTFISSIGESSRDLLLTLKTSSGETLSAGSLVQFRQDIQKIQGVVVFSKLSQVLAYSITAQSSKSASASASTIIRVNYPGFQKMKSIEPKLCALTINVTTRYNPALSDSYILRKFVEKIATYFNSTSQQMQILSYTRYSSYPIKLTIKFSNCSWASLLQISSMTTSYYQRVKNTLQKIFKYNGPIIQGTKSAFIHSLQPDFQVESIVRNESTCKEPPNQPPTAKNLEPVTAPRCGEFNYKIPADLFSDEDGDARTLRTQVLQVDGTALPTDSWVIYENKTQTLSGLPSNDTLTGQPNGGYQYRIVATDKQGLSSFTLLKIKVNGLPFSSNDGAALNVYFLSTITSRYRMSTMLAFTRKLALFQKINDPYNRFRITAATILPTSVIFSLMNCTLCSPEAANTYYEVSRSKEELVSHMTPEFPSSFYVEASGKCGPGSDGYNNVSSGSVQNVTFCGATRLNFLNLTGVTQLAPDTNFIIRQENRQTLAQSSWFWFNETSSILEVFANEEVWKKQQNSGEAYLWSIGKISTGERIAAFYRNKLFVVGTPPSTGLQYSLSFTSTLSSKNVDAYFISLVFNSLVSFLNRRDLQHISIVRQQENILRFTWKFQVCGLPTDCREPSVQALNNRIFQLSGQLRPEFGSIFPDGIVVNTMSGNCDNYPPTILRKLLNLTIPVCGLYRYKIPKDFAEDQEDGNADNLMLSLRTLDGNVLPRDSWVQFNESSHEVYAFPTESVSRTPKEAGWQFLLLVKDRGGKQVQTNLTLFVRPDVSSFYKLSFTLKTVNQVSSTTFLDIQIQFLSMLSAFFFDSTLSQYRVLNFAKTSTIGEHSEMFFLQIGNCSVTRLVCSSVDARLLKLQQQLSLQNQNSQFSRYIASFFTISSVKNESLYAIDRPPIVLNTMSVIRVKMCSKFRSDLPKAIFYDVEQTRTLTTSLTFMNGSVVKKEYWIQLIDDILYVVPYGQLNNGLYSMKLTATDHCGQSVSTNLSIILTTETILQPTFEFKVTATINSNGSKSLPPVYYLSRVKESLERKSAADQTRVTFYERSADNIILRLTNCSVSCDENRINEMKNNIFSSSSLKALLLPDFNVTNVTEIRSKNCSKPLSQPPIANRTVTVNVSVCRKLDFRIPADTFTDPEEGDTRALKLSMLTETKLAISNETWIQFDNKNQTLYGYPRETEIKDVKKKYKYWLTASDREGNTAITPLTVEITGSLPEITYKLAISGETKMDPSQPLVAQEIALVSKIGAYFNDFAINIISYRRNGNQVTFAWSFCNMPSEKCDCYKIQEVQNRLQQLEAFKRHMEPEITIQRTVVEQMLGACSRNTRPEVNEDRNELIVQPGKYLYTSVGDYKFSDYEDGFTRNLTVYMTNEGNTRLENSNWIKIQDYKICGLLTLVEAKRRELTQISTMVYKTVARDRCGKETRDSFNVRSTLYVPKLKYKVTVFLNGTFGDNCTKTADFTKKISSFINIEEAEIYIYNHTVYNVTQNSSMVVWGLRNITERNCTNGTVNQYAEKFLLQNNSVNPVFISHMRPDFEVIDVSDENTDPCLAAVISGLPPMSSDFPWWIIVLLLLVALFLLILWIFWVCIPRCCWRCCGPKLGCCQNCCSPGGKYASLGEPFADEKGILGLPNEDDEKGIDNEMYNENIEKPADIESEITDDREGDEMPLTGGYPTDPEDIADKLAIPGNLEPEATDSSGFREEYFDDSDGPLETEEVEMQQDILPLAQSAPMMLPDSPDASAIPSPADDAIPPTNLIPPLYSFGSRRRFSLDELSLVRSSAAESDSFPNDLFGGPVPQSEEPNMQVVGNEVSDQFSNAQNISERVDIEDINTDFTNDLSTNYSQQDIQISESISDNKRRLPQPNIEYSEGQNTSTRKESSVYIIDDENLARENSATIRNAAASSAQSDIQEFGDRETETQRRLSMSSQADLVLPRRQSIDMMRRASFDDTIRYRGNNSDFQERTRRRSVSSSFYQSGDEDILHSSMFRRNSLSRRSLSESNLNAGYGRQLAQYERRTSRGSMFDDGDVRTSTGRKRRSKSYFVDEQGGQGRRKLSLIESYSGDPSSRSSGRRMSSQQLGLRRGSDDVIANQSGRAFNLTRRRRSLQMNDGRLNRNAERRSSASGVTAEENFGESDSGISDYGTGSMFNTSQESLVKQRLKNRKPSLSGRPRRRSRFKSLSTNPIIDQSGRYEMRSRRTSQAFVNDAYISDSIV